MLVEVHARSGYLHDVAEKKCLALNICIFKIIELSLFEIHSNKILTWVSSLPSKTSSHNQWEPRLPSTSSARSSVMHNVWMRRCGKSWDAKQLCDIPSFECESQRGQIFSGRSELRTMSGWQSTTIGWMTGAIVSHLTSRANSLTLSLFFAKSTEEMTEKGREF